MPDMTDEVIQRGINQMMTVLDSLAEETPDTPMMDVLGRFLLIANLTVASVVAELPPEI